MKVLALITNNREITDNISLFRCDSLEVTAFNENEHILYYLQEYLPEYIIFDSEKKSSDIENFLNSHPGVKIFLPNTNKHFKYFPNVINFEDVSSIKAVKRIIETIISLDDKVQKESRLKSSKKLKIINQPVLAMLSVKGGSGSTTTAFNIAAIASGEFNLKTAFIDFNFTEAYSDISSYLKTENLPNLNYYFLNYKEGITALDKALSFSSRNGPDVFISPVSSRFINRLDETIFNSFIYQLKGNYSFIIFDYPVNLYFVNSFFSALAEFIASTIITIPPTGLCAKKVHALCKTLKKEKIYCILNNTCNSGTISRKEFEKMSGCGVIAEIPYLPQTAQKKLIIDNLLTEIIDLRNYLRNSFTSYLAV